MSCAAVPVSRAAGPDAAAPCPACRQKKRLQRKAVDTARPVGAWPGHVDRILALPGRALDADTQATMGQRFGHDFAAVRLHAGPREAASAKALDARAYTVGHHVVMGAGAPSLTGPAGRQLLAHELTHVVQQSVPGGGHADAALEAEADRAAAAVGSGRSVTVEGRAGPSVQRDAAASSLGSDVADKAVHAIGAALGLDSTTFKLIDAGIGGAAAGFKQQWNEGGTGQRLGKHVDEFSLRDVPALVGGFITGSTLGVVSPITDLFSLAVLVERGQGFANSLLQSALTDRAGLSAELGEFVTAMQALGQPIKATLAKMRANKFDTLRMLLGFAGSQNTMVAEMEKVAASLGKSGGAAFAKSLEDPWTEKKEKPPIDWSHPIGAIQQGGERLVDKLTEGPWAKVGYEAGHALGAAVVQIALLVFSEGIGNAITAIGRGLGSLAEAGTLLGRSLEGIGKFVQAAGSTIRVIEGAVDAAVGLLMKPLLPILEPVLKPLGEALKKFSGFMRRFLGVAERDAAQLAKTAVVKTEGAVATHVAPQPHPAAPRVPASSHGGHEPHAPAAKPVVHDVAPPVDVDKALAQVDAHPGAIKGEAGHRRAPAGPGHEVVEVPDAALPSGIGCELHSPPPFKKVPCPTGMGSKPRAAAAQEPLAKGEEKLTAEQLRAKHILEEFQERQAGARSVTTSEFEKGPGQHQTGKAGAGMKAKPKHHVLPQELREEFEQRGFMGEFDIDNFTVELTDPAHGAVHGGGDWRLGRATEFEWNTRVWKEIRAVEAAQGGRLLDRAGVWRVVRPLMKQYRIPVKFVPYT